LFSSAPAFAACRCCDKKSRKQQKEINLGPVGHLIRRRTQADASRILSARSGLLSLRTRHPPIKNLVAFFHLSRLVTVNAESLRLSPVSHRVNGHNTRRTEGTKSNFNNQNPKVSCLLSPAFCIVPLPKRNVAIGRSSAPYLQHLTKKPQQPTAANKQQSVEPSFTRCRPHS
jgi:hypothetical protein